VILWFQKKGNQKRGAKTRKDFRKQGTRLRKNYRVRGEENGEEKKKNAIGGED